ncbi:MAG: glycosyltransferase family 4 protein [Planctomycetales bacterium]|nr:glycosyltransferase family 4 protein [Planctomycetales bacterium]
MSYGFGEYSVRHANALAEVADVLLMLPEDIAAEHRDKLSTKVELFAFAGPRLRQPLRQFGAARKILNRLDAYEPSVLHLQAGHLWFNCALAVARRWPLVVTIHNPRHHVGDRSSRRTPQCMLDYGYRRADHVIVHGDQLKAETVEQLGIATEKIHVVPHIAMGEMPQDMPPVEEDSSLVLFFGRIWEYKGLRYLIEAEPLISEAVPNLRIMIAGRGDNFEKYRRLMVHPDRFLVENEYVSETRRYEMFSQAALVVLPYIEATQSGVVPVAYTHGKAVVATRVGALPECVDDGDTGLLVPPRDVKALADAIVQLLTDPQRRRTMGHNGRRKLEQECSDGIVAHAHLDAYQRAIESHEANRKERRRTVTTKRRQPSATQAVRP